MIKKLLELESNLKERDHSVIDNHILAQSMILVLVNLKLVNGEIS